MGLAKREIFTERDTIIKKIDLLMENLTTIKDASGEALLRFGDLLVDDKSWPVWNWPQGIGLFGIYKYYLLTHDPKALKIVSDWFEANFKLGAPPKNINTMAPILTLAFMYEEQRDSRFVPYLKEWAEWVMYEMPRTKENGFQHYTYGPENHQQLWDDTLMMAVLPLAKIGRLLGRNEYIEEAKYQFLIHIKYLADQATGLWFHGFNFNGYHNYANALWARGNAWVTIAIPEIIDILELKKGDFFREYILEVLKRQIVSLEKFQDSGGLWHTLVNDETSYLEASATAGFAYGILKAVNNRLIDSSCRETAEKAVKGLLGQITSEGVVQNVSIGTGMGDNLEHYKNIKISPMPYGQSLTVLCLTEFLFSYI